MELKNLLGLGMRKAQIARMQGNPRFIPGGSAIEDIPQNGHIPVRGLRTDLVVAPRKEFDFGLSFGLALTTQARALAGRSLDDD